MAAAARRGAFSELSGTEALDEDTAERVAVNEDEGLAEERGAFEVLDEDPEEGEGIDICVEDAILAERPEPRTAVADPVGSRGRLRPKPPGEPAEATCRRTPLAEWPEKIRGE